MRSESLSVELAPQLLSYFRTLVHLDPERVETIESAAELSIESEEDWIRRLLEREHSNEMIVRCVSADSRIVSVGEIERRPRTIERHVAEIRFGVLPGFEEAAKIMLDEMIKRAAVENMRVLYYFHLATQIRGIEIMAQLGFVQTGSIPEYYFKDGKYIDRIFLFRKL